MLSTSSPFIDSSFSVYHNAIKALIFGASQFLLALSVFKTFSLFASRGNHFASYLMFMEDPIQKLYFVISKGFSRGTLIVFCFTLTYVAASLYGTLLWGLDAPGYVMRSQRIPASNRNGSLLEYPGYISYLDIRPNKMSTLEQELPTVIGANLYKPGVNFSLTPDVNRGRAEYIPPVFDGIGGRIWLDEDGLSVTTDQYVMLIPSTDSNGNSTGPDCSPSVINATVSSAQYWNCTFNNTYVNDLLTATMGQPEVHWDTASDDKLDSKYIKPDRKRNIWASFGQGGGTVMMKQMFTITKGTRRHTFIETSARYTLLTIPGVPFAENEVEDFLIRTWSNNATERATPQPLLTRLKKSLMKVQDLGKSHQFGVIDGSNTTTTQVMWQLLVPEDNLGNPIYSLLRIAVTNITLIRSETIAKAPTAFAPCDTTFMNLAYGGVIESTDCAVSTRNQPMRLFGTVDTSAVLVVYGLGDGRSNLSSVALDENAIQWSANHSDAMDNLLIARGFIASIDPSLVTLIVSVLRPAMSYLQMFLVLISILFAIISQIALRSLATSHWSNSLLANVLGPLEGEDKRDPGYIKKVPDIKLQDTNTGPVITVHGASFRLDNGLGRTSGMQSDMEKHAVMVQTDPMNAEAQSFLRYGP
ncbi:hypothetical protein GLAREA_06392 [Glarea lozoyensis ATCC 20868]|uniref:Uncharacterized protein n=1 Tax=Glarea lozoyensis (strain ATCC 20868 / MF5171) TaxID=1116229 RepID=S3D8C4_GLAL2|nr:uncharacterized protein GLAREA_06392 [Glarea lozoyensis ATCC 20868]EPE33379.1 hypothetical protein GLAREA_06392 [Glarea lozoyensis ATCC 20868]